MIVWIAIDQFGVWLMQADLEKPFAKLTEAFAVTNQEDFGDRVCDIARGVHEILLFDNDFGFHQANPDPEQPQPI
jgi:hypothetical protein